MVGFTQLGVCRLLLSQSQTIPKANTGLSTVLAPSPAPPSAANSPPLPPAQASTPTTAASAARAGHPWRNRYGVAVCSQLTQLHCSRWIHALQSLPNMLILVHVWLGCVSESHSYSIHGSPRHRTHGVTAHKGIATIWFSCEPLQ